MNESYSPGGCRIIHREQWDENSVVDYFKQNIQIKKNGEEYNPQQIMEHRQVSDSQPLIGDSDVKPVDPADFFGSSMKGLV